MFSKELTLVCRFTITLVLSSCGVGGLSRDTVEMEDLCNGFLEATEHIELAKEWLGQKRFKRSIQESRDGLDSIDAIYKLSYMSKPKYSVLSRDSGQQIALAEFLMANSRLSEAARVYIRALDSRIEFTELVDPSGCKKRL